MFPYRYRDCCMVRLQSALFLSFIIQLNVLHIFCYPFWFSFFPTCTWTPLLKCMPVSMELNYTNNKQVYSSDCFPLNLCFQFRFRTKQFPFIKDSSMLISTLCSWEQSIFTDKKAFPLNTFPSWVFFTVLVK